MTARQPGEGQKQGTEKKSEPPVRKTAPVQRSDHYYYFLLSQFHRLKGNLDLAILNMEKTLERDPESLYLHKELTKLYLQNRDAKGALGVIEAWLEKEPNQIEALMVYGKLKQGMNHIQDARSAFEKVIRLDQKYEEAYYLLGRIYQQNNDTAQEIRLFEKLCAQFPESYSARILLGRAYMEDNQVLLAEQSFETALKLEPDSAEARFELLPVYQSLGRQDEYARVLKKLGEESHSKPQIIQEVIRLYINPKKYEQAISVLEGMLAGRPDASDIHYVTGIAYNGIKDQQRAMEHFRQVSDDSEFFDDAVAHVSYYYQEQGEIDAAIAFLTQVIKSHPDNPEFMRYLGGLYEESGKYEDALKSLNKGLELDPKNADIYFRIGVVHDKMGAKEKSIKAMKTVISLDPANAHALNYLGYTYAELGQNLDEAEYLIKEALRLKPDDGYITDSLGWVYYKKGRFADAIVLLEKAIRSVPDDPVILEHLGDVYLKMNDKAKALEYYKKSLERRKDGKTELERKIIELEKRMP